MEARENESCELCDFRLEGEFEVGDEGEEGPRVRIRKCSGWGSLFWTRCFFLFCLIVGPPHLRTTTSSTV